jgi:hypothetical protein
MVDWVLSHAHPDQTPVDRLVLVAIADAANDDGEGFPKVPRLMVRANASRAAVYESLARLKRTGQLATRKAGGVTFYRIVLDAAVQDLDAAVQDLESDSPESGIPPTPPYKEDPSVENRQRTLPPSVGAPAGADDPDGVGTDETRTTSVQLRSEEAAEAANRVIGRLKAEVAKGNRSWDWSEAVKAEWDTLLDTAPALEPARQFLMWYIAEMRGHGVGTDGMSLEEKQAWSHDWKMCQQKLKRYRSLALYGIEQAVIRGKEGQDFWNYAEGVCNQTRARIASNPSRNGLSPGSVR